VNESSATHNNRSLFFRTGRCVKTRTFYTPKRSSALSVSDQHQIDAPHLAPMLGLYGLLDCLLPNSLQFLVLLRRKNRLHLRIVLPMKSIELLYF